MNLFGLMETSGSAMQAERMRAEVVAANMANAETTRTESGGVYHRQHVIFAANPGAVGLSGGGPGGSTFLDSLASASGMGATASAAQPIPLLGSGDAKEPAGGVHVAQVVEDPAPPPRRYDPGHPDADPDGYVDYPDINPLSEMVDLMGATRAYGLNGSAVQAEKGMISAALEIART
jgi:flagellar basal-body rod protein FlgC